MATGNLNTPILRDYKEVLEYELQLLIGSCRITEYLESDSNGIYGNLVNYFKDSAYLHIRNMYLFLTKKNIGGFDDVSLVELGYTPINIKTTLYDSELINRRVMHLTSNREHNEIKEPTGTNQLNQQVGVLTDDIIKHFRIWAGTITESTDKALALEIVENAQKRANTDLENFKLRLRS